MTAQLKEEAYYREQVLRRVVEAVKALSSRGLPFRGSNQILGSNENGNFLMILETISKFDPFLMEHLKKHGNQGKGNPSYLSANICNEVIRLMGETVLQRIIKEIKENKYFSVIIDSTPDVAHVDELAIVIRYVNSGGDPVERFMTFLPDVGHKATDMFSALSPKLSEWRIEIKNCRGQSYDNAYNMAGEYKGLHALIKRANHMAEFIPCAGHSLNLVGNHSVESNRHAVTYFQMVQALYNFFVFSTGRWKLLAEKSVIMYFERTFSNSLVSST